MCRTDMEGDPEGLAKDSQHQNSSNYITTWKQTKGFTLAFLFCLLWLKVKVTLFFWRHIRTLWEFNLRNCVNTGLSLIMVWQMYWALHSLDVKIVIANIWKSDRESLDDWFIQVTGSSLISHPYPLFFFFFFVFFSLVVNTISLLSSEFVFKVGQRKGSRAL